jgi:hypothetical protein
VTTNGRLRDLCSFAIKGWSRALGFLEGGGLFYGATALDGTNNAGVWSSSSTGTAIRLDLYFNAAV